MKKLFLLSLAIVVSYGTYAQIETPQPSPFQKIEQTVGLTKVTLEYSRPSMRGRTIFGGLVPYGELWRTGANENTKITFSDDVNIGGTELKAGSYAIYTKPNVQNWEIYFYSDSDNWGTPQEWDESKVVVTVKAQVDPMAFDIQSFTIAFSDITNDSANLRMLCENVSIVVPIKFITDKLVSAEIERVMSGPSANDYYASAVYYLESGKDINKAQNWIDKAIELREEPAFWYHRQKSLIYAKAGNKKVAINAAQTSLKLAKEAGNDDYIALNTKSLKEWGVL